MKVTNIATSAGIPSKLILTITTHRQKLLLMSIFYNTQSLMDHANSEVSSHILIGDEDPFTIEEVKDMADSIYIKL